MCHSRYRDRGRRDHAWGADWRESTWDTGRRDAPAREPDIPEPHDLRASDAERERTVELLRLHAAAGRLATEELEERLDRALAAERRADLAALLSDLPPQERARPVVATPRPRHGKDPRSLLPIAVLLVAIWALTGAGYFWPVWPLMWFAFAGLVRHRASNTRVISNTRLTE
jgi:hypothetical protein